MVIMMSVWLQSDIYCLIYQLLSIYVQLTFYLSELETFMTMKLIFNVVRIMRVLSRLCDTEVMKVIHVYLQHGGRCSASVLHCCNTS